MNTIWLALVIGFLVVESLSVGLVSIWFSVGALGALVVSVLGGELWLQITVFAVISVAALLALRPISQKYLKPRLVKTNLDSVIGSVGLVTEAVDNLEGRGQVKLGGMYWTARSQSGEPIPAGTKIKVYRIEGVKVFVSPEEETSNV